VKPIVLFSIQFSLSLVAYGLIAAWYVVPRLSERPREAALQPLLWVHAFRVVGGAVLAPGAVAAAVLIAFQRMVGYGDLISAALALIALAALRARLAGAIAVTWTVLVVGMADTINAIIQSMRYSVFNHPLGVNWVIVTIYVPALLVSSALILWQLLRSPAARRAPGNGSQQPLAPQTRNHAWPPCCVPDKSAAGVQLTLGDGCSSRGTGC